MSRVPCVSQIVSVNAQPVKNSASATVEGFMSPPEQERDERKESADEVRNLAGNDRVRGVFPEESEFYDDFGGLQ